MAATIAVSTLLAREEIAVARGNAKCDPVETAIVAARSGGNRYPTRTAYRGATECRPQPAAQKSEVRSGAAGEVVVVVDDGDPGPAVEGTTGMTDAEDDLVADFDGVRGGDPDIGVLVVEGSHFELA